MVDADEAVHQTDNLKLLSLFSGAGGMDIGLELAGFQPVACLEIDALARATLAANRPGWHILPDGDVTRAATELKPDHFGLEPGELDLLAGGPPCQPFSTAGQWASTGRQGMSDLRAATVHGLLGLFESFRPRVVLLENVQGFAAGPNSASREIQASIDRVNQRHGTSYELTWKLLNAADYGVPQNRRRAIIIIADQLDWQWPKALYADEPATAWDALSDLHEASAELPGAKGKWANLLACIPEGQNYQWLTSEGGGPEVFGYRTRYWHFLLKLAKNQPSWTLSASPGPSVGPFHWDSRPLSIRERMRLQSFPDEWRLLGGFRDQVKLAGNATPPLLAEVLGRQVARLLGRPQPEEPLLLRRAATPPPEPTAPIELPGSLAHLVGQKARHAGHGKGPAPRRQASLHGA